MASDKTQSVLLDKNRRLASSFVHRATFWAMLGEPVIPVEPKSKACILPGWEDKATTDSIQIAEWNKKNPHYNVGKVSKYDIGCTLDADHISAVERILAETGHSLPETLMTTGSKPFPLGHYHLHHTDRSRQIIGNRELNLKDADGSNVLNAVGKTTRILDFKVNNSYVVEAGSVHPNGTIYEIAVLAPVIPIPDWLCDWIEKVTTASILPEEVGPRSKARTRSIAEVAARILTRDLSRNTTEANRALVESMGFEGEQKHRHVADQKFAIWLVRDSGLTPTECKNQFQRFMLHEDRREQYVLKALKKAEEWVKKHSHGDEEEVWEIRTTNAAKIEPENITWLFPGLIPLAMLANMYAPKGKGKTKFCDWLTMMVTTGKSWPNPDGPDFPNEIGPRGVIRLNLEDDAAMVLSPNLIAAGADMKLVEVVDREAFKNGESAAVDFSRQGCVDDLLRLIKQFNAALTIIEPLTNYKGKAKSNSDDDVRPIYQHLAFVAKDSGSSVLTINHVNKKRDVDVLDKSLGAGSGPNVARVNLYLNSPEADPDTRLLTDAGSNVPMCKKSMSFGLVKHPPFEHDGKTLTGCETVVFKSFSDKTAEEMHEENVAPDKKDANKIATWLKEFIGDREVNTTLVKVEAIKENRKWEWANVRQVFKRTCDAGLAHSRKAGKYTYWSFGDGHKVVVDPEPVLDLCDPSFNTEELERNVDVTDLGEDGTK